MVGSEPFRGLQVVLPIGLSFYTFHSRTYIIDLYRGHATPARSFTDFSAFVALFPDLVAGPIIRYKTLAAQLAFREHTVPRFAAGISIFVLGFAKKILLANPAGNVADAVFNAAQPGVLDAWFGVLAYAFQVYFDFCGYSDMAVGLGRMLGFEYLKNFDAPYLAESITELWRRWHISLSSVLRDYLYFPLGGNRRGETRTYVNLAVVMLLGGLWHGANWTFVAWGAYHGLFLSLDKLFAGWTAWRLPRVLAVPLTFLLVTAGWVFFRYGLPEQRIAEAAEYSEQTIGEAATYLARLADVPSMFRAEGDVAWLCGEGGGLASVFRAQGELQWRPLLGNRETVILAIAALISFLPAWISDFRFQIADRRVASLPNLKSEIPNPKSRIQACLVLWAKFAVAALLLVLSICSLVNLHFNPFLYFRF